ncbi:MAG: 2-hydroxychromene-2-carboxylate isomerase [Burkholderiales bacterium]
MANLTPVYLFFNFRSPYCYLASKSLFALFEQYHTELLWRPLGGWDGRSPPDRAAKKIPISRQDVARFAKRMGIPFNPPPKTTDGTLAGVGSLLAEEKKLLKPYVVETMRAEWAEGRDIGEAQVLLEVADKIGLAHDELMQALNDSARLKILKKNWEEAERVGVIGVPTFVVGDQIFWGNDRIDFVHEHLRELHLARP